MLGSKILDVAIGLVFVYIIVSVLCTAVREGLEAFLKTRAAYLEHGIRLLLQNHAGDGIVDQVFSHPLIDGLFMGKYKPRSTTGPNRPWTGGNLPSYIPTKSFATALLDIAARGPVNGTANRYGTPMSLDLIRRNVVTNIPGNPKIQRIVLHAVDAAQGDLDKAQKSIEDWYDSAMDRVSGWYKRTTHFIILVIGLLIAVGMNVDSLAIIDQLYKSDAMREAVVAAASKAAENYKATSEVKAANAKAANKNAAPCTAPCGNNPAPLPAVNKPAKPNPPATGTTTATSPASTTSTTPMSSTTSTTSTSAPVKGTSDAKKTAPQSDANALGEGDDPYHQAANVLNNLHLPVGWEKARVSFDRPQNQNEWFKNFVFPWIGWILTALAASLGAPFWFDVLNKFMVIRSTVKPHEKSPEESSEDRQKSTGTTVVVSPGSGTASPGGGGAAGPGGGNLEPAADPDADGCDVLQSGAFDLTDDSQLPVPLGGVA